jgi:phage shock protein C
MNPYCSNCGASLPPVARFCSACGAAVAAAYPYGYGPFPPPGPFYQPRLLRPIFGRQFAGVCAAVARTYGWDVGAVRILTVIGAIFFCPFVEVAYIAGWIGIPEEPLGEYPPVPPPQQV